MTEKWPFERKGTAKRFKTIFDEQQCGYKDYIIENRKTINDNKKIKKHSLRSHNNIEFHKRVLIAGV